MRREEIKMNVDEIGLAKASPFSFLPEASLQCKPLLIKGGVGVVCLYSLRKRGRFLQGCCI